MSDEMYPYLDSVSESDEELTRARECFLTNKLDMKFYINNSLFTWAGAKVNRTISLLYRLRFDKNLEYNYLKISGITPKDVAYILSQPKPDGAELAALLPRSSKQKQKYDHILSDELMNHEYACTYLDVDKAWNELQELAKVQGGDCSPQPCERADGKRIYDFRHIGDISNVIKYDTLSEPLHKTFMQYIQRSDLNCEVQTAAMFPGAPDYAMPINFLLSKDGKSVAVLLVHRNKVKRYSVLETEALCQENGVDVKKFYFEFGNEEEYVVDRLRKALK